MKQRLLLCALCLTIAAGLTAQRIANELLLLHADGPVDWKRAGDRAVREVHLAPGIVQLIFPEAGAAERAITRLRKRYPRSRIGYNYRVSSRAVPDDPEFFRQDNMSRAGFETAWNATTGGQTADGQPIVVAVLDDGFDLVHPDLVGNVWRNAAEIPGDGRDNDGNGYVDDLQGWNFVDGSPGHPSATHGTSVAGLIGATGNNGTGVAGTNWRIGLMPFTISTVADIVAAYQYVIDQRTLFNNSGGQRGAFVVATNASFGVEGATCADFPAWAAMYDRLGAAGVLTAASVVNVGKNVDAEGDMPIDCPTTAIVGVTNLGPDDLRFPSAGYGRQHVDLAAPGEGSYTTRPNAGYGNFGSTSAAAPYVTGAIALLYATPDCPLLASSAREDPAGTAATVRRALLTAVRPIASLANTTATGGTLDIAAAQRELIGSCGDAVDAFGLDAVWPIPASSTLNVATSGTSLGDGVYATVIDVLGRNVTSPPVRVVSATELRVDVSNLLAGVYFLRVVNDGQAAGTKILVHGR